MRVAYRRDNIKLRNRSFLDKSRWSRTYGFCLSVGNVPGASWAMADMISWRDCKLAFKRQCVGVNDNGNVWKGVEDGPCSSDVTLKFPWVSVYTNKQTLTIDFILYVICWRIHFFTLQSYKEFLKRQKRQKK